MRPLRIAHVVFDLDRGGLETVVVDLARQLSVGGRVEISVLVLSGDIGRAARAIKPYVALLESKRPARIISMFAPASIARWIRHAKPDVVHLHSGAWFKPAYAAKLAGARAIVYTEHGRQHQRGRLKQIQDAVSARMTDAIVAVSPQMIPPFARDIRVPESTIRVIINGVDTERFRPASEADGALRASLGIAAGAPLIGSVGRFEHVKGGDVLFDAFERLLSSWSGSPSPHLLLVGEGSCEAEWRQRIAASPSLSKAVHLLPWSDDPASIYRCLDVYVMASRSEGTSVSLLEALSSGLCPVVTAVGGNAFVLGPDLAHRLVPSESPAELAGALLASLSDPRSRRADGVTARARVEQHFSVRAMAEAYESLYREVCSGVR